MIQEPVPIYESDDYVSLGIFAGVYDALSNKLSRLTEGIQRLPSAIAGSLINELQTKAEAAALGNVYGVSNRILQGINDVSGQLTGRKPLVGPFSEDLTKSEIYPKPVPPAQIGNGGLGKVY